jgi:very-short-patch-repair endonuclease
MDVEVPRSDEQKQGLLEALLHKTRRSLVDTGSRNRLISFPKGSSKAKTIEVIDELSDQVFDILLRQGKKMAFLPGRKSDAGSQQEDEEPYLFLPAPEENKVDELASRHTDTKLQTRLTPEGLQKRLMGLFRDAKSLFEEQGTDVLYLALGFLEWYEAPQSETARFAPLVLLPIELVRDDARSMFKVQIREEDLSHNIALEERFKQDHGILLPPIPEDEEWIPQQYFAAVREAVASQKRWRIDENSIALGFFSFTKIGMYRDLDPANWPDNKLLNHPLIQSLLVDGFTAEEPLFPDGATMDEVLHPADMIHVVDADGSQALVIEAIRQGRNLVVQGPPGTGKSQTITNIIATAVREGKRVLFIAEKLAALNVVYSRLQRAGLSAICLELHSRNSNKRAVLEEIAKTLNAVTPSLPDMGLLDRLCKARDQLNRHAAILNTPIGQTGVTAFQSLGMQVKLVKEGVPPPYINLPQAGQWTASEYSAVTQATQQLAKQVQSSGSPIEHPWRGVGNMAIQPAELSRLVSKLQVAANYCQTLEKAALVAFALLKWDQPLALPSIHNALDLIRLLAKRPTSDGLAIDAVLGCKDRQRIVAVFERHLRFDKEAIELGKWFTDRAMQADIKSIRDAINAKGGSMVGRLSGTFRTARDGLKAISMGDLPDDPKEWVRRLDRLIAAMSDFEEVEKEQPFLFESLGPLAENLQIEAIQIQELIQWVSEAEILAGSTSRHLIADTTIPLTFLEKNALELGAALQTTEDALLELGASFEVDPEAMLGVAKFDAAQLPDIVKRLLEMNSAPAAYDDWVRLKRMEETLVGSGGEEIAKRIFSNARNVGSVIAELSFCRAETIWSNAVRQFPELGRIEGDARLTLVDEFCQLEQQRQQLAQREVLVKHGAGIPRGSMGQIGTIRSEIARRRGHMAVRKLVGRTGEVLQKIKPVMLMSPLSIAQFLPPKSADFDLLVIDEASQVKPEDALGAIARCKQIVVIGDKKQLPPTSFFDRMINDEELESEDEDAQVVSTLCEARGVPGRMLRWHYRSKHPSLIEVSNLEFYGGDLFLPPSPKYDRTLDGFVVTKVQGAYDRGGKRTNKTEAEAVVEAVRQHARTSPVRSLGVVTFSVSQRQLIQDLLEFRRQEDKKLDQFMANLGAEEFFVKNLENVQGDERDVIFVSIGYGPRAAGLGLDSMSFGPVSSEGGERRLNVLFTRARFRCEVFVSFTSGDIDLSRTSQRGPEVLKRFLRFGETGSSDLPKPLGGFDSPFEESVAEAIASMGYEVDSQVGSVGFRIDLAVKNPQRQGQYICAIECDGANYHSTRSARERDRLRQSVLEGLGWKFHRIWSTDWFRNTELQKQKLRVVLSEFLSSINLSEPAKNDEAENEAHELLAETESNTIGSSDGSDSYEEAKFSVSKTAEPYEVPIQELAQIAMKILEVEWPIHKDEVTRRVSQLFGKERAGSRIASAVSTALQYCRRTKAALNDDDFWSPLEKNRAIRVRNRADATLTVRRAEMLPPAEIKEAIRLCITANGKMDKQELVVAVTRLMGFERAGPDLKIAIEAVVSAIEGDE